MKAYLKQAATALNYNEKGRERWTIISDLGSEYSIRYTVSSRGQRALYNKLSSEGLSFPPTLLANTYVSLTGHINYPYKRLELKTHCGHSEPLHRHLQISAGVIHCKVHISDWIVCD